MNPEKEFYKDVARIFRGIAEKINELDSKKASIEGFAKKLEDNVPVVPDVISLVMSEIDSDVKQLTDLINEINLLNKRLFAGRLKW